MKLPNLAALIPLVSLLGCSKPEPAPAPEMAMSTQQRIEKIQNDSTIPDGLKKIQIEALQHQPGAKP